MNLVFTRNFTRGYNRCMRYLNDIIGHRKEFEIKQRLKTINFFDKYGLAATKEAFEVSRATIYLWKKRLKESDGRLSSLASKSRTPKNKRNRKVNKLIKEFIIDYRCKYKGIGKEAIKPALDEYCKENDIETVSESTIGRVIKDLKGSGMLIDNNIKVTVHGSSGNLIVRKKKRIKKLRRKGYKPKKPGDLVQIDSVTVFFEGVKRYLITGIDLFTKFAFAMAFEKLNSRNCKTFFIKLSELTPFKIKRIQTDNGKEFEKDFKQYIRRQPIIHYHCYAKRPQSNGGIERFNRTVQEQFVSWEKEDLIDDIYSFNNKLMEYLIWYNTKKPHRAINKLPPLRYYLGMTIKNTFQSNMLWTLTFL